MSQEPTPIVEQVSRDEFAKRLREVPYSNAPHRALITKDESHRHAYVPQPFYHENSSPIVGLCRSFNSYHSFIETAQDLREYYTEKWKQGKLSNSMHGSYVNAINTFESAILSMMKGFEDWEISTITIRSNVEGERWQRLKPREHKDFGDLNGKVTVTIINTLWGPSTEFVNEKTGDVTVVPNESLTGHLAHRDNGALHKTPEYKGKRRYAIVLLLSNPRSN